MRRTAQHAELLIPRVLKYQYIQKIVPDNSLQKGDHMRQSIYKYILVFILFIVILVVLTHLYLIYSSQYAVSTVDRSVSPDERYTVVLQTVGWQEARLTLRKSGEKISVFNFPYGDDLLNIEADKWSCEWETDHAEVIIYDPIKEDRLVRLYFDGEVSDGFLGTYFGKPVNKDPQGDPDAQNGEQHNEAPALSAEQLKTINDINTGYSAVLAYLSSGPSGSSAISEIPQIKNDMEYDRIVLAESTSSIEYIQYDRESANGRCGLYAHFICEKDSDGTWSISSAQMLDLYAYDRESGSVIPSGKTDWETAGSEAYAQAAGEH